MRDIGDLLICNQIINKAKGDFYTDIITNNSSDSKKLWKELNNVLHRKPENTLPDSKDEWSLANSFSSFFTDKITKIHNSFTDLSPDDTSPDEAPSTFQVFTPVTENQVLQMINASPTKSCMLDPWPTFLLKEFVDILLPTITRLINYSMSEGLVPSGFKKALITPLLKKSSLSKEDFKNYRPVSNLGFISKLVERAVASQIKHRLNKNNLINPFQSAYKPGHSTETALLCIKNDIHMSLAEGMPTALVLLDLSAAFDTISHDILLNRLSSWFGFGGSVLKWFVSYLSNRAQSVKVGNSLSDPALLISGVPQGSVLGPALFSLYTTPLSRIISSHKIIKYHFYADDTQIYIQLTPSNCDSAIISLQKCLLDVERWMYRNKLKLNPEKTEFIVFGKKSQRDLLSHCFWEIKYALLIRFVTYV